MPKRRYNRSALRLRRMPLDGEYQVLVIRHFRLELLRQAKMFAAARHETLECTLHDAISYGLAYMAQDLLPQNVVKMADRLRRDDNGNE